MISYYGENKAGDVIVNDLVENIWWEVGVVKLNISHNSLERQCGKVEKAWALELDKILCKSQVYTQVVWTSANYITSLIPSFLTCPEGEK